MPNEQFSAIAWQVEVTLPKDNDDDCFVLDQHAELDFFYSSSSLK